MHIYSVYLVDRFAPYSPKGINPAFARGIQEEYHILSW